MKKLDIVAILLLMAINWFLLAILYRYEYFVEVFTVDGIHIVAKNVFIYGHTIIFGLMIFPRYLSYMYRKQIKEELGDVVLFPFLNYYPNDVSLVEVE